jgi:dihydropteroate synthase
MGVVDLAAGAAVTIDRGRQLLAEGACCLEVGFESETSRPSTQPEIEQILSAIEGLSDDTEVSVRTTDEAVARAGLGAGATILSDRSGTLFGVAAECDATIVATSSRLAAQDSVIEAVAALSAAVDKASLAGVAKLIVDPGIGLSNTVAQNMKLLASIDRFTAIGVPVMVGTELSPGAKGSLEDSIVVETIAAMNGVHIVRTRQVRAALQSIQVVGPQPNLGEVTHT